MREIKFRAYDNIKNMVFDVWDFRILDSGLRINEGEQFDRTVGLLQYTGLKDKNGKEIYEGDIGRYIHKYLDHPRDFIIKFKDGFFGQEEINCYGYVEEGLEIDNWVGWDELEIIGNIYENPELLEEVK